MIRKRSLIAGRHISPQNFAVICTNPQNTAGFLWLKLPGTLFWRISLYADISASGTPTFEANRPSGRCVTAPLLR